MSTPSVSATGETAEQIIGKYAVSKIGYASGRSEQICEKVSTSSATDWEKVMVIIALISLPSAGRAAKYRSTFFNALWG